MSIEYQISPILDNDELNRLMHASWPDNGDSDWSLVLSRSLVYVCGYDGDHLIGFVNVAWDGGVHAFLLDTTVHPDYRRQGVATQLVKHATQSAKEKGATWLHVDYEPHLASFYEQCGFRPTDAGLIKL